MAVNCQTFREKRFRGSLPYLLFLAVSLLFQVLPDVANYRSRSVSLFLVSGISLFLTARRLVTPLTVITIDQNELIIRGVEPGWWKLFQRYRKVSICFINIEKIQIGKIRNTVLGIDLAPLGEPSKAKMSQEFLWIYYRVDNNLREIYYPHIPQIADSKRLIEELRNKCGERVELFPKSM